MTKISIVILSWNTKALLKQCLGSLKFENYEIIVVDNGSTDGSVEMVQDVIKHQTSNIKLIVNKTNLGFAKGNNQGIERAKGEYVLFLNSDTIVKRGAIEKLVKFLDGNPGVAAVSPLLLNEDGSIQKDPCYLKFPSPLLALFYYNKFLKKLALRLFPSILFSALDFEKPVEVDQLPGAAMMLKSKFLEKVGGFDKSFPIYFNDVDLSFRIKKLGYKLMVVPEAKIVHFGRKSVEPLIKKEGIEKFYFLNFNSLFLFCEKNYPAWKAILIKIVILSQLVLGLRFKIALKLIRKEEE